MAAYKCGKLGAGPMIGVSPTLDREMKDKLVHIAKDEEIPYQMEVMGGSQVPMQMSSVPHSRVSEQH